ncbi:Predicted dithiol-disulfide oxidoreductase, DUF899 family [Nakamurella panacisegetis]|uniref:Predicted dithiol-disulfide oxidoreductase, DUF899 family n=1 Tax=Nakamurella panacisegetis TaxID=1090615 RepID=A0A1H0KUI6_9ACTN|nr:DUF899 domain-containing protein [Nakamurella panacisegetis]SDO59443.1 Predicted dithiol-disulfide oxidoreductase, DUF899 family [Nakamurella panacisegetis]
MALPDIVSRQDWLDARRGLLEREKELTRARDQVNAARRRLPMVRIDKEYVLEGPDGPVRLLDLFAGRRQLVLQHFMFDPAWDTGCPSCTADVDEMSDGLLDHLAARDTAFAAVSRAPYPKLAEYRAQKGWDIAWYSSFGSDFNYDFHVTLDAAVAPVMFNYRDAAELEAAGLGWINEKPCEQPGISCFLRDGDEIFHTYSTFGRGTEQMGGAYAILDMTALGRQEAWEEPKGRSDDPHRASPDFA